jgi:hypothetical protein
MTEAASLCPEGQHMAKRRHRSFQGGKNHVGQQGAEGTPPYIPALRWGHCERSRPAWWQGRQLVKEEPGTWRRILSVSGSPG